MCNFWDGSWNAVGSAGKYTYLFILFIFLHFLLQAWNADFMAGSIKFKMETICRKKLEKYKFSRLGSLWWHEAYILATDCWFANIFYVKGKTKHLHFFKVSIVGSPNAISKW